MSLKVDILQGGTNDHGVTVDDFNAFGTDFLSDGVVGAITNTAGVAPATGAFSVNAQGTPDKTVAIGTGTAYVTGTPTSGVSQKLRVVNDASYDLTIADNATGGTRYDWVYISLAAAKMKDPAVDSDDVATLVASRSTSSSSDNGTPPTYGYCIAVITVANAFTTITNATIADKRTQSTFYPIRNASLTTTAGEPGGAWKSWTPTWANLTVGAGGVVDAKYTQIGKTIHFRLSFKFGTGSAVGAATFTLPVISVEHIAAQPIGNVTAFDSNTAYQYSGQLVWLTTTTAKPGSNLASGTYGVNDELGAAKPMTWATDDYLLVTGTYEAA